jgi:ribosomal protein S18 acetylase RimI-like enzyme
MNIGIMNGAGTIEKVLNKDITVLRELSITTFSETFQDLNTSENMRKYIDDSLSLGKLTEELEHDNSEFYFIHYDGRLAGYLKINIKDAQNELKNENALEIERIYVLKDFHGKGLGLQLLQQAVLMANRLKKDFVWLGVWEKNSKAIRFYRKSGFVDFDQHKFILGEDVQTDIMMKLELGY